MKIAIKKYQILNLCLPGIGIIVIIFFLFHNIPFLKGLNHLLLDQFIYYTGHHLPADDIVLIVIDEDHDLVSGLHKYCDQVVITAFQFLLNHFPYVFFTNHFSATKEGTAVPSIFLPP